MTIKRDLPKHFHQYFYTQSPLFNRKKKLLYKLVQLWKYESDIGITNNYIDEMQLLNSLSDSDYVAYNIDGIRELEDKYKALTYIK